jgi:hypothetical protein
VELKYQSLLGKLLTYQARVKVHLSLNYAPPPRGAPASKAEDAFFR